MTKLDVLRAALWEYSKIKHHEAELKKRLTIKHSKYLMWSRNRLAILKRQYHEVKLTGHCKI